MELISATEAGRLLGLSSKTVRRYVTEGKLTGYRTGVKIVVDKAEVQSLLANSKIDLKEEKENDNDK